MTDDERFHKFTEKLDQLFSDLIELHDDDLCDPDEVIKDLKEDYLLRILRLR